ncbi:alpha/beta hydrolase [Dinoroseobacter sp. S76]|uniref:alpha/beta hydrolase n=1 Tax=Dinoroseobacter sp. S76 TaxID=3415124 RepID=UPI003C7AF8CC
MQAFWDSQFKFSEILPDFAGALARMGAASAAVAERNPLERAAYGPDPRQWVEWIAGHGPETCLPVILHGGYWRALEAETHRFMMPAFQPFGAAVANVEYRLMPAQRLGDLIADTAAALHTLATRFPEAQFLLVGHSAGAHLALSAMADRGLAARTQGVLALSGVYDLRPVAQSFLQEALALTPAEIAQHSLSPEGPYPPTLYLNGDRETHEFLRGGALMGTAPRAAWRVLPGADHMSLPDVVCAQAPALLDHLTELGAPV